MGKPYTHCNKSHFIQIYSEMEPRMYFKCKDHTSSPSPVYFMLSFGLLLRGTYPKGAESVSFVLESLRKKMECQKLGL